MSIRLSPLHNPALLPGETLLAEFTARGSLLRRVLDIIRDNHAGCPPQHLLLIGPRGMRKSTMLWAIAHSINLREATLKKQWQPVVFDDTAESLINVLPGLAKWCANNPRHLDAPMIHGFVVGMWVRLASLKGISASLELLSAQPEECRLPFAPLEDAFIAAGDSSHLLLLAPERAELVAELLKVIRQGKRTPPKKKKKKR